MAAIFFSSVGPLALGIVLDSYGPRVCSICAVIVIALGFTLFAYSDLAEFDFFVPAMCMIAFGGPGAQSAIIHLSNLFPAWKATATAMITGSFQVLFPPAEITAIHYCNLL